MDAPFAATSVNVDDDVWELACDEAAVHRQESAALEREWQIRHAQFHNLGYRDGLEVGKNSSLQAGFDVGYREAASAGYRWGVAKGAISAYAVLPPAAQAALVVGEEARARLQALHSRVNSVSSADALRCYNEDTVMQSGRECRNEQGDAMLDDLAGALRGLNVSQGSNGTSSEHQGRLEELERQVRVELAYSAVELSIFN